MEEPRPGAAQFRAVLIVVSLGLVSTYLVAAILARLTLSAWPWEGLPGRHNQAEILDVVKVSLAVVAGFGGAVALVTSYRRQALAEREEAASDILRFDQRFGSAAAQLGGGSAAVRLAGVYAMASLADQYPARRQQCVDVLCGYLRLPHDPATDHIALSVTETTHVTADRSVREQVTPAHQSHDRQVRASIIHAIAEHLRRDVDSSTHWSGLDLHLEGAYLVDANFADCAFVGGVANFNGAEFVGSITDFGGATFRDADVDFRAARFNARLTTFRSASFNSSALFSEARFASPKVLFDGVRVDGGVWGFDGVEVSGREVNFNVARFSDAVIDFRDTTFASDVTSFEGAYFRSRPGSRAFTEARFIGSGSVRFTGANFQGRESADFAAATFSCPLVELSVITDSDMSLRGALSGAGTHIDMAAIRLDWGRGVLRADRFQLGGTAAGPWGSGLPEEWPPWDQRHVSEEDAGWIPAAAADEEDFWARPRRRRR